MRSLSRGLTTTSAAVVRESRYRWNCSSSKRWAISSRTVWKVL